MKVVVKVVMVVVVVAAATSAESGVMAVVDVWLGQYVRVGGGGGLVVAKVSAVGLVVRDT